MEEEYDQLFDADNRNEEAQYVTAWDLDDWHFGRHILATVPEPYKSHLGITSLP